jgi:hypothetical protein
MKQTAVEWLVEQFDTTINYTLEEYQLKIEQAKAMEKEQMLMALNISAKEAYQAGQKTMYCGCYTIEDATTFEQWVLQKHELNKSE